MGDEANKAFGFAVIAGMLRLVVTWNPGAEVVEIFILLRNIKQIVRNAEIVHEAMAKTSELAMSGVD